MALYLTLNADATGVVSDSQPISTRHSSDGEAVTIPVYITNSGKRVNVANDTNPPALIYTNISIGIQGTSATLQNSITSSISDVTLTFDTIAGWNIGTIIKLGLERMRVESVLSTTSILVTRNYTSDGKSSTLSSHAIGETGTSETSSVSLALPNPNTTDYSVAGTFLPSGSSITTGVDPSILTIALDSLDTSNIVKSNNGLKYAVNSIIKIDAEQMKVIAVSGNDVQVLRGYNSTARASHAQNSIIYCVGLVDLAPITHKIFVKNSPVAGLPTQKKKDIKIIITADEEPI